MGLEVVQYVHMGSNNSALPGAPFHPRGSEAEPTAPPGVHDEAATFLAPILSSIIQY